MKSRKWLTLTGSLSLVATLALASCGSSSNGAGAIENGKNCKKVGVLLPESSSSARWEGVDRPNLQKAITDAIPGSTVKIDNANGSDDLQLQQAEADLTAGYCILIVAPHDSVKSSQIVQAAKADKVPVIAYDRLIADPDLNFYVSFDNVSVGEAQGNYIKAHYSDYVSAGHNNISFINGSPTDNNATLFAKGVHNILDPLISAGTLNKVYEVATPDWDNPTAQTEMEGALTANSNNIQIAYVANDGMAQTVIAALTAQKLNGKVLVTGQDATVDGIQQILLGNQAMTVYKPIINEATGAAQLAAALSTGSDTSSIAKSTTDNSGVKTPSLLLPVTSVDKTNVASTVIKDGYVTKADACKGLPAGTGGIC